ncbi:MAG: hypothetical protein Q8O90_09485 [Elusimicrobiota bacterium]|nr:hypothetical protein [Elusimicrobiota bacterium]
MNYKLRIKYPSGAEFEAEGPAEFILSEKDGFINRLNAPGTSPAAPAVKRYEAGSGPDWDALADTKNDLTTLKNKHLGVKAGEAALLILAAERQLKSSLEISALTLSKAVKVSGYAPERLDRVLAKAIKEGLILASGTKRNRAYQITDKGLEIAWLKAAKLAR